MYEFTQGRVFQKPHIHLRNRQVLCPQYGTHCKKGHLMDSLVARSALPSALILAFNVNLGLWLCWSPGWIGIWDFMGKEGKCYKIIFSLSHSVVSETFSVRKQGNGCALSWITIARESEPKHPYYTVGRFPGICMGRLFFPSYYK